MHTSADSYRFGRFQLWADGTLLLRDGVAVPLAPKVLQTLLVLVQHAGTVVKKADLIETIWPDSIVEDTGLTRNISVLRHALSDEEQRLIITVARIGYRFAGPVEHGPDSVAHPPQTDPRAGRQLVVGRGQELDSLRSALDNARSGRGGIVALAGEPGIGKTTAAETFLEEVSASCRIGTGRCSERFAGAEPHLPILEALDELTSEPLVRETLRRKAPTWSDVVAPGPSASGAGGREGGAIGSQERLIRELTIFLEETSRHQPVVIFIDDLQWADVATVDVLSHLAPRVPRMRVLIVVTYRQHELALTHHPFARLRGELIARGHLREVPLRLLALDDVRSYVQSAFGGDDVPADLPAFVFRKTEGNPLFMTDLVRYVRETGIPTGNALRATDVPDSLRALIERMLERFDAPLRQLLSIAAVQGYEFDSATVARVSGVATAEAEERLRGAAHVHAVVSPIEEREMPDGTPSLAYRFVHVLYQDALYGSIAPSRRIAWAQQIAEALLASHGARSEAIAGPLAVLFETGRDFWQAAQYFLVTSKNAVRLFAFAAAAELADRGLHCLQAAAVDEREKLRRELDLTFAKLVPLASLQGYASAEVESLARRVVELGEKVSDPAATAAGLAATWIVRMVRGLCLDAKEAGERLVDLARASGSDVLLINGHMEAQIACHHLGEFREAEQHTAAVLALAPRVPPTERCISILDPVVGSLAESARNLWITGYLTRALIACDEAVALGRKLGHPDSLAFASVFHGWIHGYRGNWQTTLASVESGIAIAQDAGSVQTLAWNRCVRGWALAHRGDIPAGVTELTAGIESSKAIMGQVALPQFSAMMAEVFLLRGDIALAEEWLTAAADVENANDDRYFSAEIHRLCAICLAARGRTDAARTELRKAIDVARSQEARFFELRAALALAGHSPEEGRAAVAVVLASFPEPDPWPEIEAARRMLR